MFNAINEQTTRKTATPDRLSPPKKLKRSTVSAACQNCRSHKLKCDEVRPCQRCVRKGVECVYTTQENETQRQANNRQHEALAKEVAGLKTLFDLIALEPDEEKAQQIYSLIRRQHSPQTVMRLSNAIHGRVRASFMGDDRLTLILVAAHSTASLDILADLVNTIFGVAAKTRFPVQERLDALKGKMITTEILQSLLKSTDGQLSLANEPQFAEDHHYPPFSVPCRPWTTMLETDEEMSQLFSVFLCYLNPLYQFVDEDIILECLRNGDLSSQYCSQFLVHAVLALASWFCDYDKAFAEPGRFFTRGEHFLKEALRFWDLENRDPSIRNIRALLVTSFSLASLGSNAKCMETLTMAVELSKTHESIQPVDAENQRAVFAMQQAVALVDFAIRTTYLLHANMPKPAYPIVSNLSSLIPDESRPWYPFPFRQISYTYNPRTLAKHREDLLRFMHETTHARFEAQKPQHNFMDKTTDLISRFKAWKDSLPEELVYSPALPSMYFEIHAIYGGFQLLLHDVLDKHLTETMTEAASQDMRKEIHSTALEVALSAATIVRDYRLAFGLKIVPSVFVPLASMASFRLLKQLQLSPRDASSPPSTGETEPQADPPPEITDTSAALEECIRCLLAVTLQQALPMSIAQAVYKAALDLEVYLPRNVLIVLTALIKPVLQPLAESKADGLNPEYDVGAKDDVEDAATTLLNLTARGREE